jgi:hypothetical protein
VRPGLTVVQNHLPAVAAAIRELSHQRVMVGVPSVNASVGRASGEPSNADLAFWHDNGAPEANVPARPFSRPGILRARAKIEAMLRSAGKAALGGHPGQVMRWLHAAGLVASSSVRNYITEGIAPPLAASTVAGRIARRKSKPWRAKRKAAVAANVAAGLAPGAGLFTPLIDTGALRAAITYVVRRVR